MKLLLNAYLNYGLSIILCSAKEAKTARYSPTEVFQRGSVLAEKYFKGSAIEARLLKLKQEAAQLTENTTNKSTGIKINREFRAKSEASKLRRKEFKTQQNMSDCNEKRRRKVVFRNDRDLKMVQSPYNTKKRESSLNKSNILQDNVPKSTASRLQQSQGNPAFFSNRHSMKKEKKIHFTIQRRESKINEEQGVARQQMSTYHAEMLKELKRDKDILKSKKGFIVKDNKSLVSTFQIERVAVSSQNSDPIAAKSYPQRSKFFRDVNENKELEKTEQTERISFDNRINNNKFPEANIEMDNLFRIQETDKEKKLNRERSSGVIPRSRSTFSIANKTIPRAIISPIGNQTTLVEGKKSDPSKYENLVKRLELLETNLTSFNEDGGEKHSNSFRADKFRSINLHNEESSLTTAPNYKMEISTSQPSQYRPSMVTRQNSSDISLSHYNISSSYSPRVGLTRVENTKPTDLGSIRERSEYDYSYSSFIKTRKFEAPLGGEQGESIVINRQDLSESILGKRIYLHQYFRIKDFIIYLESSINKVFDPSDNLDHLVFQSEVLIANENDEHEFADITMEGIVMKEEELWEFLRSIELKFFDSYPFDSLDFNHCEFLLKNVIAKYMSIEIDIEKKMISPLPKSNPDLLIESIDLDIFDTSYKVLFYYNEDNSFFLAFQATTTNEIHFKGIVKIEINDIHEIFETLNPPIDSSEKEKLLKSLFARNRNLKMLHELEEQHVKRITLDALDPEDLRNKIHTLSLGIKKIIERDRTAQDLSEDLFFTVKAMNKLESFFIIIGTDDIEKKEISYSFDLELHSLDGTPPQKVESMIKKVSYEEINSIFGVYFEKIESFYKKRNFIQMCSDQFNPQIIEPKKQGPNKFSKFKTAASSDIKLRIKKSEFEINSFKRILIGYTYKWPLTMTAITLNNVPCGIKIGFFDFMMSIEKNRYLGIRPSEWISDDKTNYDKLYELLKLKRIWMAIFKKLKVDRQGNILLRKSGKDSRGNRSEHDCLERIIELKLIENKVKKPVKIFGFK